MMKKLLVPSLFLLLACFSASAQLKIGNYTVDTVSIASRLHVPWEILWGPDDKIWFTERNGKISKVDPVTKQKKVLFTFNNVHEESESGLLGLALHPNFPDSAFVYTVYTYKTTGILERLVRLTYNPTLDNLGNEKILIDNIKGNTTHDGSRLKFGPDGKLYMTTGEAQDKPAAQDLTNYNGKILRINSNGSIPSDNPNPNSHIWSYGHRNPQGLTFGPNGIVYNSEHGENENDEINIITKNKNYGWPYVRGFCDNDFDFDANASRDEMYYCNLWNPTPPIKRWSPTLATAGLEYYGHTLFADFTNSLLLVTLKEQDFRVLKLASDGLTVTSETISLNATFGRLRDICVGKNGEIYISTSETDGRGSAINVDDRIIKFTPRQFPTGIDGDETGIDMKLFPNPSQGFVRVQGLNEESSLEISSTEGKSILSQQIKNNEADISQLSNGYYIYKIKTNSGVVKTGKLVVSKP